MFTGIIETLATLKQLESNGTNKSFWLETSITNELKIDQSIAHNGVCLTVEAIENNIYKVTAIEETLQKTNLQSWKLNDLVNIERCLSFNGRLDGHFVQGHVDTTAICKNIIDKNGSWEFEFEFDEKFASLVIEKGSICVNGTSLTCFNVTQNCFTVAIIPYTYHHTNISNLVVGSIVNIEFDIIGKYINRMRDLG
ncbi:MAG: riboflavin synthase [Chitinophagaceae bacterium]